MKVTEVNIKNLLEKIISDSDSDSWFDVEIFKYKIMEAMTTGLYDWELDAESQVNFVCGIMDWIKSDKDFDTTFHVILFTDLSVWAEEYFNK